MKINKKLVAVLTVILSFGLAFTGCTKPQPAAAPTAEPAAQVSTDKSWDAVKEKGELRVGLCAAYPPFESRNEKTGEFEGFDIDIANALGQELGVKATIIDAEWQALLGGMNKGDYDVLITCMSKKEASVENVNMSDVYYNLNDIIVVKKGNDTIKSKADLANKVVGVQLGSGSEQAVDKLTGLKEVKRYNYNPEAFLDLKNGRIDAVVVGYVYALTEIAKDESYEIINDAIDSSEIVIVSKAGGDALTSKLNEGLAKVKQSGKYDELVSKWLTVK